MPVVNDVGEPCAGEPHARNRGGGGWKRNARTASPRQSPTLLLVPGGRWHTVTIRPVAAANSASSVFHCRVRYPLEPPPSALIIRRVASGCRVFPICCHQVAMVFTAKAAVSWSVPTDTHPVLVPTSYTPYGLALPSSVSMKSWTLTCSGSPLGCHSRPLFW